MRRLLLVLNDPLDYRLNRRGLALAARRAGWDVHLAAPEMPGAELVRGDGFPFHPIQLHPRGLRPDHEIAAVHCLVRLLTRLRPDVLHLRAVKLCLLGGLAARICESRPAVVSHFCGLGYMFAGGSARSALRLALSPAWRMALSLPHQVVVVQHAADRDRLVADRLVRPSQVRIVPGSGVDTARFQPRPEPPLPFTVVLPGRLLRAKGVATFAAAAPLAAAVGIRFVLVGGEAQDNPDSIPRRELDEWLTNGALAWWGERKDMPAVYAESHAVCLPSTYGEGIPKIALEAAACGLPLVLADAPWSRATFRDGKEALLVRPGDHRALADAVVLLAKSPELRQHMARRLRQRAETEFTEGNINNSFLSLYAHVEKRSFHDSDVYPL